MLLFRPGYLHSARPKGGKIHFKFVQKKEWFHKLNGKTLEIYIQDLVLKKKQKTKNIFVVFVFLFLDSSMAMRIMR